MKQGVFVVAKAGVLGCVLGKLGVVSGIHIYENNSGLGGGIWLKLCKMKGSVWVYQCV